MADPKERPILMSAPMVRAILAGTKTQTRRAVKFPQAPMKLGVWEPMMVGGPGTYLDKACTKPNPDPAIITMWHTRNGATVYCPYGQPGDRLWVRESFAADPPLTPLTGTTVERAERNRLNQTRTKIVYRSDWDGLGDEDVRWTPSIHMPRWASRITLEVTGVRVERLQEISADDCVAEGIEPAHFNDAAEETAAVRAGYQDVWESINGAGSWDANPWVWCVSFRRLP